MFRIKNYVLATIPLSYFSLAPATALLAGRLFCSLIKLLNAVLPVVVFTRAAVICKTAVLLRFHLKECSAGCSLNELVAQQSCLSNSHGGGPVCYEEAVHCFAVCHFLCQGCRNKQDCGLIFLDKRMQPRGSGSTAVLPF